jgi:uncharacterized membrane protein
MAGDPLWMKALLSIHILCGGGAFVLAPVALATAKGGRVHRRWGKVYLYCMGGVAATAIPMAIYRPILFLAMVAIFSFYAAFSAYRVLQLKGLARGESAKPIDWIAGIFTFASSLLLALLGAFKPSAIQGFGIVSIIFGFLGMRLAYSQLRSFIVKPKEKMFWWYTHLGNFIASYIAAWTAFSVVTIAPLFGNHIWLWLWPTAVGVPAIVLTSAYYHRKFTPKSPAAVA